MHVLLTLSLFSAAVWKGNWRHWEKYIHTIFYVIICNLLYNILCNNHLLWKYHPDLLPKSHTIVELLYSFINLPAVTLLFLTHYPFSKKYSKQMSYIIAWIIGSIVIEYPFYKLNRLLLLNGYKYWMEIIFYTLMYSMIRLHYTRPLWTYGFSLFIIVIMLWYFKVPIK